MLAVAVFDATSVMVAVIMQTINIMTKGGRTFKPANCSPNHIDRPDSFEASDKANPPPMQQLDNHWIIDYLLLILNDHHLHIYNLPSNKTIPHGSLSCTYFQSNKALLDFSLPLSIK